MTARRVRNGQKESLRGAHSATRQSPAGKAWVSSWTPASAGVTKNIRGGLDGALTPREPHRFLGGGKEGARLVEDLLVLGGRIAVGNDAAAGLDHHLAVLDDGGAQHDAGVHAAIAREIADGAGIEVAALGLELVDDLHGAHLRRARERAGGEARDQRIHRIETRVDLA